MSWNFAIGASTALGQANSVPPKRPMISEDWLALREERRKIPCRLGIIASGLANHLMTLPLAVSSALVDLANNFQGSARNSVMPKRISSTAERAATMV